MLDQGYWPDGLMTAPSDEALVHDIESLKRLGFTMLRKHIKIESMRWYHHCDRLGMLVWQDAVNGGGAYRKGDQLPGATPAGLDDTVRRRPWAATRRRPGAVRARSCGARSSSPTAWSRSWCGCRSTRAGASSTPPARRRGGRADPSRLVDHASGWHDQGAGDLWSLHLYQQEFRPSRPSAERRAVVLSEYGGVSLLVPGHASTSTGPSGTAPSRPRSVAGVLHPDARQIAPAVPVGLTGTVFTQLCDIEDEVNGLLTYDREQLEAPREQIRAAVRALRDRLAGPPR